MTKSQMLSEVQDIFRDVLDNDDIVLAYETYSDDIDEWDSLTHIQLVVAIEKHFHVKFTSKEITSWTNVGEMLDCILKK